MMIEWINETDIDFENDLERYLGFIYCIELTDGRYYYGRKQFWSKRGREWYESDWRSYQSSSNTIIQQDGLIARKSILAVFESKSAIRYAEAAAIIESGSYLDRVSGLNGSFQGSKGYIKLSGSDREQLSRLEKHCFARRRVNET